MGREQLYGMSKQKQINQRVLIPTENFQSARFTLFFSVHNGYVSSK